MSAPTRIDEAEARVIRQRHASGETPEQIAASHLLDLADVLQVLGHGDRHRYPSGGWGPAHVTGATMRPEPTMEQAQDRSSWGYIDRYDGAREGEPRPRPLHAGWTAEALLALEHDRPHPYRDESCPDAHVSHCYDHAIIHGWAGWTCHECPLASRYCLPARSVAVERQDEDEGPRAPLQLELFPWEVAA